MAQGRAKIRLFVGAPLTTGAQIEASPEQAHYLLRVMRLTRGARVLLFNGRDGEWLAEIVETGRRALRFACLMQTRPQTTVPDLWLLFAPVKKARMDFMVEKATELGCRRLVPVVTARTVAARVKQARLEALAIEAAEQSGRLEVPEVAEPVGLTALLANWEPRRRLWFCDEKGAGPPMPAALDTEKPGAAAILVGPEGGFTEEERSRIVAVGAARAVSLGPRILRAETAALAALALWQARHGDWQ